MNYSDLITLILTQLRTHVNSDQFLEQFRRSKAFVRHRKLTLKQVVAYLICLKKRSMDIELSALQRQIPDIQFPDVSRQAVSKARRGILPDLFKELFDELIIPGLSEPPVRTLRATIPGNESQLKFLILDD